MMHPHTVFKELTIVFLITALFTFSASGQSKNISKIYAIGYTEYKTKDTSRLYKPYTQKKDPLHFRPIELDIWYPAAKEISATALPFHYFLSLFERRANSFQDNTSYTGLADELMQQFTISSKSGHQQLITNSYLNAPEIKGKFPLIIYLCAYNGMSYENVPMFENLASRGYIVVSVSSIGRYPGNMTTKYPDVIEQVKDAEFAMQIVKDRNIDTARIGVIGYSYGGLAATIMAIRNKNFKAVLSLDGSETHYYGSDKLEDKDFDTLRHSGYLTPTTLQQPYTYLESDHKLDDGNPDSTYRLQSRIALKHAYIRLNNATHEDFSDISALDNPNNLTYELVKQLAMAFADQYISANSTTFDTEAADLLANQTVASSFTKVPSKADNTIQLTLKGKVASEKGIVALPYVSIGVPARNCGTISDNDGNFSLSVTAQMRNDTIRLSSLGYQSRIFTVNQLAVILKSQPIIRLKEQVSQLKDVAITARKPHLKTVGNTSTSKFFSVGFPFKDLGSEVGVKVSLGKKTVRVHSFNFNISYLRIDTGMFRLNIYNLKDGLPDQNLLTQNILVGIKKPGAYHIDLTPYRLQLKGNIFISLEWIAGKTSSEFGAVFFSAGLLASSYRRKTPEASWNSFKGLGAGFYLKVER